MSIGVALPVIAWTILLARMDGKPRALLTHLPAGAALGLGTSSVIWWAIMLLPLGSRTRMIAMDSSVWAIACLVIWRVARKPAAPRDEEPRQHRSWWPALMLLALAAVGAGVYFVAASVVLPHGTWDAWAIWNARARFLLRGYPDVWTQAFSPAIGWSHPDYPLLLPASVARAWTYIGGERVIVPIAIAATFGVAILTTAAASVTRSTTAWRGALTAVMILASPVFLLNVAAQWADVPLAFYILATCVFAGRAMQADDGRAWWTLAGVAAGLAAWTKNEGIAFAAIAFVVYAAWACWRHGPRGLRRVWPLLAGAAPILAALVAFKLMFAPANDLVAPQSIGYVASHLRDVHRVRIVLAAVAGELWLSGSTLVGVLPILALFVAAVGLRRPLPAGPLPGLAIMAALVGVDAAVYLLTPRDLEWHLSTSLSRVLLQIFPAIVWCGMSLAAELPRAATRQVTAAEPAAAASTPGS